MRHLRRHANALAQLGMRVDGLGDVHSVCAHLHLNLHSQRNPANHVARKRADHAAAQDLAVAVRFRWVIEQQFDNAVVATVGNGAAR